MIERYIPNGAVAQVYEDVNAVVYLAGNGRENPYIAYGYSGKRRNPDFKFRYRTSLDREISVAKYIKGLREAQAGKIAEKKAKDEVPTTLKVGDILYSSWGYDQTNVDFYKVVQVSPSGKSVDVAQVAQDFRETGFRCGVTAPVPEAIVGEVIKNKRVIYGDRIRIASYASASKYDGQPKYTSSYA